VYSRKADRYFGLVIVNIDEPVFASARQHLQLTYRVLQEVAAVMARLNHGDQVGVEDRLTDEEHGKYHAKPLNPDKSEQVFTSVSVEIYRLTSALVQKIFEDQSLKTDLPILATVTLQTTHFTAINASGKIRFYKHAPEQIGL
jgi:hypothetical protein